MTRVSHVEGMWLVAAVCLMALVSASAAWEEQTVSFQSFEAGPADDWGYEFDSGTLGSVDSNRSYSGYNSFRIRGSSYSGVDPCLVFSNVDLTGYTNIHVTVAFAASGPDSSDDLYIDLSYDQGANWFQADSVKLVDGYNNASIEFGETSLSIPETVATNPWSISLPGSATQVMVRLKFETKDGSNASIDSYYVDDLRLYAIPVNQPPELLAFSFSEAIVSQELTIAVAATDIDGDGITLGGDSLPPGAAFSATSGVGDVTGEFRFTPDVSLADGSVTARFYAVDIDGTNYASAVIPVVDRLLSFSRQELILEEGGVAGLFNISLSRALDATVTVTRAGTASTLHQADYGLSKTTLVFSAHGSRSLGISVSVENDSFAEGWEDALLGLAHPAALTPRGHTNLALRIRDNDSFTVLTGNLPSYGYNFRDEAKRILQALKPDIAGLQEFNVTNAGGHAEFVDDCFGTSYDYVVDGGSLPNAIVSRWPITDWGEWYDDQSSSRYFLWATIDIPGSEPLHVLSVHFAYSAGHQAREAEARALTNYIAQAGFQTNGLLVICGDLNTTYTGETCLAVLTDSQVTDERAPEDQQGVRETNSGRYIRYDYLLPGAELNARHIPTCLGGLTFSEGLVFDTRLWTNTPIPSPAQIDDSDAPQVTHMALMKTFALADIFQIVTETGQGGRIEPRNPGVSFGMNRPFTITPDVYYQVENVWTNEDEMSGAQHVAGVSFTWSNVVADGSVTSAFSVRLADRGVPHWWLAQYGFTNDLNAAVTNDSDADAVETWQEWYADTNPTNDASYPGISRVTLPAGSVVSSPYSTNCLYVLESCTNLPRGQWVPAEVSMVATSLFSEKLTFTVPNDVPSALYRVRIERR